MSANAGKVSAFVDIKLGKGLRSKVIRRRIQQRALQARSLHIAPLQGGEGGILTPKALGAHRGLQAL